MPAATISVPRSARSIGQTDRARHASATHRPHATSMTSATTITSASNNEKALVFDHEVNRA
jgi:hypothetical protein